MGGLKKTQDKLAPGSVRKSLHRKSVPERVFLRFLTPNKEAAEVSMELSRFSVKQTEGETFGLSLLTDVHGQPHD